MGYYDKKFDLGDWTKFNEVVPFSELYTNGIKYGDLVQEFSQHLNLFEDYKNLDIVNDPIFILDVITINEDTKIYSRYYQNNPYLQYLATKLEWEIFQSGMETIEKYTWCKSVDLQYNQGATSSECKQFEKIKEYVEEIWQYKFFEDKSNVAYIRDDQDTVYSFDISKKENFFGEKTLKEYNKLERKFKKNIGEQANQIQVPEDFNWEEYGRIIGEYMLYHFDSILVGAIWQGFGYHVSTEKLIDILSKDENTLAGMILDGKV